MEIISGKKNASNDLNSNTKGVGEAARWKGLSSIKRNFQPHIMNGHEAEAGLTMPRHAPAPNDYDIWVAQKPPMLIDWPR